MLSFGYKYKNCRHKIVKTANSQQKSGLICKRILKYLRGGLGGPPIFVACQSISSGDRAVGSGAFFVFRPLSLVSVTFLCKYFMFIYIVYIMVLFNYVIWCVHSM
jgi:hypothetical protein